MVASQEGKERGIFKGELSAPGSKGKGEKKELRFRVLEGKGV